MKTSIIAILLLIGCGWSHSAVAKPPSARYSLNVQEIKGDSNKTVSLRDNKMQRTLWTRTLYTYAPKIIWSPDKRAVFVGSVGHFLVWREGHALRDFGVIKRYDYTMGCAWSPDNQRLLIRFGVSAMSDVGEFGVGRVFCLELGSGKFYKYSHVAGHVSEMKWRDSKTVLYRVFDSYENGKNTVTPLLKWRVR